MNQSLEKIADLVSKYLSNKLTPEESELLIDSLDHHGEHDLATAFAHKQQGESLPPTAQVVASRGDVGLKYTARRIETVTAAHVNPLGVFYVDDSLISQDGLEPDVSSLIDAPLRNRNLSIRQLKEAPNNALSTWVPEYTPKLMVDDHTGHSFIRAQTFNGPNFPGRPVYFVQPNRCADHKASPSSAQATSQHADDCN